MLAFSAVVIQQAPSIEAGGLLYPGGTSAKIAAPERCIDRSFDGEGAELSGLFRAPAPDLLFLDNQ